MVSIKLKDGESGYDVVEAYVIKFWGHNSVDSVIVSLGTSYNGMDFYRHNEIVSPVDYGCCECLSDWWEGEKYINIYGIKAVDEIDVSGGLY